MELHKLDYLKYSEKQDELCAVKALLEYFQTRKYVQKLQEEEDNDVIRER